MERLAICCKSQRSLGYQLHASTMAIFIKITVLLLLLVLIIIIRIIIMMISIMIIIIISVSHKNHQLVVFIPVLRFPCLYRWSYSLQLEATLHSCCLLSLVLCWSESTAQNFVWRLVTTNAKRSDNARNPCCSVEISKQISTFSESDSFRDDQANSQQAMVRKTYTFHAFHASHLIYMCVQKYGIPAYP